MLDVKSLVLLLVFAACGAGPQPIVYMPTEPIPNEAATKPPATAAVEPPPVAPPADTNGHREFAVPTLPMGLILHRGTLVWVDMAGALWTMPADGSSPPKQQSEQHRDGLATHPFVAGDRVLAKAGKDLLSLALPDGPVKRIHVTGTPALFEEVVGNATTIYMTVFQHDQILKVSIDGGAAQHVADVKNAILALHGKTLYTLSYLTGELNAIPLDGGKPRKIAAKLDHATAFEVDDNAVYVYTEGNRRVARIDLATGASTILGDHLDNSDELALAGDFLYTVSWPDKLVALPSGASGGGTRTIADHLFQPRGVAVDDKYVYVTSDRPSRIVRVPRI